MNDNHHENASHLQRLRSIYHPFIQSSFDPDIFAHDLTISSGNLGNDGVLSLGEEPNGMFTPWMDWTILGGRNSTEVLFSLPPSIPYLRSYPSLLVEDVNDRSLPSSLPQLHSMPIWTLPSPIYLNGSCDEIQFRSSDRENKPSATSNDFSFSRSIPNNRGKSDLQPGGDFRQSIFRASDEITALFSEDHSTTPGITEGFVRVELMDGLGRKIDSNRNVFQSSDEQFQRPLNRKSSVEFSLKVLENSGQELFCLLFTVYYITSTGEKLVERIQSRKFAVQSNKALKARKKPKVFDIKPMCGINTEEIDVWIKGSDFHRPGENT
eukprot:TRINITY_DN6144_c0_g1_i1.p1 TRINITY_DN6144_c0_g1~~TRINITY_DN6144_c0_g1_i1.p1  ORF type:complete len:323 (+),score=44.04 TRINITY_DN6144_c0_g1_i1:184-1152(+)